MTRKYYEDNRVRNVCIVISVVLAIALVFSVFTSGFRVWDPKEWFGKDEGKQEQPEEKPPIVDEHGAEVVGVLPMRMIVQTMSLPVEKTLTASIDPPDATVQTVKWTVAFVDPSSEWATGKTVTDYVTVTPTEEGALTATVKCLQAFGEQIKITVTSTDNPEAHADCTADFQRPVTNAELQFNGATPVWRPSSTSITGSKHTTSFKYTYGTGTVNPPVSGEKATLQLTSACASALKAWHASSVIGAGALTVPMLKADFTGTVDLINMYSQGASLYLDGYIKFMNLFISQDVSTNNYQTYAKFLDSLVTELKKHLSDGFEIKVECSVDGAAKTFTQSFRMDLSEFTVKDLHKAVTDVTLDDSDLLFK